MLHMQLLVCGSKMESRSHPRIEIGGEEAMGSLESVEKARRKGYFIYLFIFFLKSLFCSC